MKNRSRRPMLEALENRQLLSSNVALSALTLSPPTTEPAEIGQAITFEAEACNIGDTSAQPLSGELGLTRHRSIIPTHAVHISTPELAPSQCEIIVIDVPRVTKSGLFIAQATLEPEGPTGDLRNSDNSRGISVQFGTPDFEIVADPRVVLKNPPLRSRGRNDLTLLGRETPIEVRVRNNGPDGPIQSYIEVTVSRFGFNVPEWVGAVEFDLRTGRTLRATAENNRSDDPFPRFWTPQHAGVYVVSAVADPPRGHAPCRPTARARPARSTVPGQPRGAILETVDTNGDIPDPEEHFSNNAKFVAIHVHV